jgi:3-oxoadipate enol-lactonase
MKTCFVKTSHGRLHYLRAGRGVPLILLHSNGCSAYEYEQAIPLLAKRYDVISWDMPGHGDSDTITRHYTIQDYAGALIEFMDGLGLSKAHVLGSSVGGSICAYMGEHHNDRLESLLFVETPTRSSQDWEGDWALVNHLFGIPTQTAHQLSMRINNVTPEVLLRWNIDRNKAGTRVMFDVMWAIKEYDIVGALAKIQARSLVLFGDKGPVIKGRHNFETKIPDAKMEIMNGSGHFPMLDDANDFSERVIAFLG